MAGRPNSVAALWPPRKYRAMRRFHLKPLAPRLRQLAALAGLTSALPLQSQVAPVTAVGTGDWTTAAVWSPQLVPGASNSATIASETITVSDARSISFLTLSGGGIVGTGTLTLVNAGSVWSGGNMNGA